MKKLLTIYCGSIKGIVKLFIDKLEISLEGLPQDSILALFDGTILHIEHNIKNGLNKIIFDGIQSMTSAFGGVLLNSGGEILGEFGKKLDEYEKKKLLKQGARQKAQSAGEEKTENFTDIQHSDEPPLLEPEPLAEITNWLARTPLEQEPCNATNVQITNIDEMSDANNEQSITDRQPLPAIYQEISDPLMLEDTTLADVLPLADYNYFEEEVLQKTKKDGYFADLLRLFETEQRYEILEDILPDSKFVKINFDQNKYYVVGGVFDEGELEYVVYGLPAENRKYSEKLTDAAEFFEISKDLSFYFLYQDAKSGEIIKRSEK